jgi:hypothetical protein
VLLQTSSLYRAPESRYRSTTARSFFFKRWGGVRNLDAGRMLRRRTHDGFPHRVSHPTAPLRERLQKALAIKSSLVQIA